MRTIDADKLYPDCMTKNGTLAISQNQIANAPTVETYTKDDMTKEYLKGYNDCKEMTERPQGEWLYNDKLNMFYCKYCGLLEPFTKEEIEEGFKLPNFCQQCGADMRGETE